MSDNVVEFVSERCLAPGHEVLWYAVEKVLGQGGFGITYLAHDRNLDRQVAIKEYLPAAFARREADFSVRPLSREHEKTYEWGLNSFLREAQTLAKFGHENIVRVHSVFEKNGTAYMVMEYELGENLASRYRSRRGLDQEFFEAVFLPILDGLKQIHQFGFIHRDIKPANIYIRKNQTPVLIDFGSARETSQQKAGELTTLITHGYTPLEQYNASHGEQGPWTDIYALAATLHEGVLGVRPDQSMSRSACVMHGRRDSVPQLTAERWPSYSSEFLDAINSGLELEPGRRPKDIDSWLAMFRATERRPDSPSSGKRKPANISHQVREGAGRSVGRRDETLEEKRVRDQHFAQPRRTVRMDINPEPVLFRSDSSEPENRRSANKSRAAPSRRSRAKLRRRWLIGGTVLIASLAAITYSLNRVEAPLPRASDSQSALPVPAEPIGTVLPKELVLQQLEDMKRLAGSLREAVELNASLNTNELVADAFDSLGGIAINWSPSQHPDVAQRIEAISLSLPGSAEQRGMLLRKLDEAEQNSDPEKVVAMLRANQIVEPQGNALVNTISSLNVEDLKQVVALPEWERMMQRLRARVIERMRDERFEDAAVMVEIGLTLSPQDEFMQSMRRRLALR